MKSLYLKSRYMFLLLIAIIMVSVCLLILKYYSSNIKTTNDSKVLTNAQWIEDINYLENILTKFHPYLNKDRANFDEKINQLRKDIPKLNDFEITLRIMQVVASIGDGHTTISLNTPEYIYPFYTRWYDNNLMVDSTSKNYQNLLGTRIAAINGVPIERVIDKVDTLIPNETDEFVKSNDIHYIINPEILKFFGFIDRDKVLWTFENNNQEIINMYIAPVKYGETFFGYQVSEASPSFFKGKNDFYDYWYKYIPKDKVFYFRYDICYDKATRQKDGFDDYNTFPVFSKFLEKMENTIKDSDIDKFIIDLRYNPGGNSELIKPFVDMLSNNQKINRKGKLFVITGKETFSGGVWAAADILEKTDAISFGEPTGGLVNCAGNNKSTALPNSKITLIYSTKQFNISDKFKGRIVPDVIVHQSLYDVKLGIDDVYEAIKKYGIN